MLKKTFTLFSIIYLTVSFLLPATAVKAAGASLFLSPSSGTKFVGDKFSVLLYVSSAQSTNTYDVYLSVSNLTVTGFSVGGSICILYPSPPSYTSTSAHFRCGLPTPGYTGSGGYISSITVKGNVPGTAKVFVDANSQVLANDGAGTNILASRGTATFNIQPQPTSAPSISSSTHPDQDKWYKNNTASLSWSGAGTVFSWEMDKNPDTVPDQNPEPAGTNKTFENLDDGVWYFHVRVKGASGTWSPASSYRLQIDTTPPESFTPEADPKNNIDKLPIIAFNTVDKTSGVDHYEVKLDEDAWQVEANPYKLPKVTSGKHTVYVKAVDKAGNERIGSVDITVKEITAPIILQPEEGSILTYGTDLIIKGQSFPGYSVKIFLDGKEIATVVVDKNGNFGFIYKELLREGDHKITAIAINPDKIESNSSKPVTFHVDSKAYVVFGRTIPGIIITTSIFILITIFILIILFLLIGARRFRKKLKKILEELEEKVEKDLAEERVGRKIKEKIEEEFEEAEREVEK